MPGALQMSGKAPGRVELDKPISGGGTSDGLSEMLKIGVRENLTYGIHLLQETNRFLEFRQDETSASLSGRDRPTQEHGTVPVPTYKLGVPALQDYCGKFLGHF